MIDQNKYHVCKKQSKKSHLCINLIIKYIKLFLLSVSHATYCATSENFIFFLFYKGQLFMTFPSPLWSADAWQKTCNPR